MRAAKARRRPRARHVADAALHVEQLLDALEADRRLGDRVGHLREVLHRLVGLAEIEDEDDQLAGAEAAAEHQARAVAEHQAGADRDEHVDHRRQPRLHAARAQAGGDVLPALPVEPLILVVFARERLHHLDRGQLLRDARHQLAFALLHQPRRLLDPLGVDVDEQEHHRRDRQADQREAPVHVEHDAEHADQRQHVDDDAEQRRGDEVLDRVDVAGDAGQQIAGPRLAVLGERQALDALVDHPPQIVRDPLRDAGGQELFAVGADRADHRDQQHAASAKFERREGVVREQRDDRLDARRQRLVLQHVVDDDLHRPRLEDVGEGLAQHREQRQRQRLPVRAHQVADERHPGQRQQRPGRLLLLLLPFFFFRSSSAFTT